VKFAIIGLTKNSEAIVALEIDRKEIKHTKDELNEGLFHIQAVPGAISYTNRILWVNKLRRNEK